MTKRILITSALPYANGPQHFGHIAGAFLPGDCFARFERMRGNDVLYICGSDEHGVAITLSAQKAGRTPKEQVDLFHALNQEIFAKFGISFDHYSRTTAPLHAETTREFFKDLLDDGYIEARVTDQLYSEEDQMFLADRYVTGTCPKCGYPEARGDECTKCGASFEATDLIHPKSLVTGKKLILKPTKNWFLLFDQFKGRLSEWLSTKDWKPGVLNFAKQYVEDLKPRSITRDCDWGISVPLPEAKGKVFYVWFDAPIGYISATKEWAIQHGDPKAWEKYWLDPDTKYVQFIGKDNIPFHAVFFPAMVMGQKKRYNLVSELPANEFFMLEGRQFSKSDGWYIDLEDFFTHFTADQIRYAIASNAPENQDSEFKWKEFQSKCNADLVGKFGNFANRVLTFTQKELLGHLPKAHHLAEEDKECIEKGKLLFKQIEESYAGYHLRKASAQIMELAALGNVYFDKKAPWKLAKDPDLRLEMETALYVCFTLLKLLSLASGPIMPGASEKLWYMIGCTTSFSKARFTDGILPIDGKLLPIPNVLFQKVEDEIINKEVAKLEALKARAEKPLEIVLPLQEEITFEDVSKIDLRVGKIEKAERVPKSSKLLKLIVDIGLEKRQIVAGIGKAFEDLDVLIGKKVVVVANLKPAKLMGIESQGMLLAASLPDGLELPSITRASLGAQVK